MLGAYVVASVVGLGLWGSTADAATIDVNTRLDELSADHHCSLRESITSANNDAAPFAGAGECARGSGADTIVVPAGRYKLTIAGTPEDMNVRGDLDVRNRMTIVGAGANATTIDGNHIDRVFNVVGTGDGNLTIRRMTVTGGKSPDGSKGLDAVGSAGATGQKGSDATGGNGTAGAPGGGIFAVGRLAVIDSTIIGNATGDGGNGGTGTGGAGDGSAAGGNGRGGGSGFGGDGGGIAAWGSVTLIRASVRGNKTGAGGTGGIGVGGAGGGAAGHGGTGSGEFGGYGGFGGGVFEIGAGSPLTIDRSSIVGNRTGPGGTGGAAHGGTGGEGIGENTGGTGGVTVGGFGGTGGVGGGIEAGRYGLVTNSLVTGNATGSGGRGGDAVGGTGGPGAGGSSGTGGTGGAGNGQAGGHGGDGGAIDANATMLNDTLSANTTGPGGGGGDTVGGHGGMGGTGGGSGGNGGNGAAAAGGIGGDGGGFVEDIGLSYLNSTLTHLTIVSNKVGQGGPPGTATGGPFGAGVGGGSAGATGSVVPAGPSPPGRGGAVVNAFGGSVTLRNTIVASNAVPSCAVVVSGGPIVDGLHNIAFPDTSCPGANVDPKLGPLADNGGLTKTLALKPGSPAINAVPLLGANCASTDQRGIHRPQGFACDIGAFEFGRPRVVITRPHDGAHYRVGKHVRASFSCTEDGVPSAIRSCVGTVSNGQLIDTRTASAKTFTVTAIDKAGNRISQTVHYTVKKHKKKHKKKHH